jgi:hypothetical protein
MTTYLNNSLRSPAHPELQKTFIDHYYEVRLKRVDPVLARLVEKGGILYASLLDSALTHAEPMSGPFNSAESAIAAICEAGRLTVEKRMVDSFFGNISYRVKDTIYLTQTSTTLDELEGCIDPCPIDDSMCTGITASNEYKMHKEVFLGSNSRAILRGYKKFSVIYSMLCEEKEHLLTFLALTNCGSPLQNARTAPAQAMPRRTGSVPVSMPQHLSAIH